MTNEENELYGFQIERAHYMLLSKKKRHMNKCLDNALKLERKYLEIQYPGFKGDE